MRVSVGEELGGAMVLMIPRKLIPIMADSIDADRIAVLA